MWEDENTSPLWLILPVWQGQCVGSATYNKQADILGVDGRGGNELSFYSDKNWLHIMLNMNTWNLLEYWSFYSTLHVFRVVSVRSSAVYFSDIKLKDLNLLFPEV